MDIYPPGTMIGQYEIVSQPLMGGMGIVYFCIDHQNDLPVALKTFKPEFLPDREAHDRFLREGATWVGLGSHPHIVRCYQVKYFDPTAFLVLELVAKEPNLPDASLRSWLIPGRPVPIEHCLLFGLQIARGMQHACEKLPGFAHRDLKPENVLVGVDKLPGAQINRLRVTDFGLARVLEEAGQSASGLLGVDQPVLSQGSELFFRTQLTHGIVGTPPYMAPEQWQGKILGVWTDVYALGCILYELLAGQCAAPGQTLGELEVAHCNGRLRPLPKGLPGGIVDILQRCLRLARKGRYEDWTELIAALEGAFVQQTGHAAPATMRMNELGWRERVQAGWSYNAIGLSYMDISKTEVATGYFERALAAGQSEGEQELASAALNNLGMAYRNLGDARRAIEYHEKSLAISREIGNRQTEEESLINLGVGYAYLGDSRRAIGYYEQGLKIACETGDRKGEGITLLNLGKYYSDLGDFRLAIKIYEQSLAIAREIGHRSGEGRALGNLGATHIKSGDFQLAINFLEQSLAIAREIGNRSGEGNTLINLGAAYSKLGDYQRSINFFEQSLAIIREIGDRHREGEILVNLGTTYLNLGDFRLAIKIYEQSLAIAREIGNQSGEVLVNLGHSYMKLGDVRQAIVYSEQALVIYRETGNLDGVATVSFNMALFYFKYNDNLKALPLAQRAVQIWGQLGSPNIQNALLLMFDIQKGGAVGSTIPANTVQAASEAFQHARSPAEMRTAVHEYPFMTDARFIQAVEKMIGEKAAPGHKKIFKQHLSWLRQIAGK